MFERRAFDEIRLSMLATDLEYFDEHLEYKVENPELFSDHSEDRTLLRDAEGIFNTMSGDEFTAPAYEELSVLFDVYHRALESLQGSPYEGSLSAEFRNCLYKIKAAPEGVLPESVVIPHFPDHYSRLEDALDSFEDSPYSDEYNSFVSLVNEAACDYSNMAQSIFSKYMTFGSFEPLVESSSDVTPLIVECYDTLPESLLTWYGGKTFFESRQEMALRQYVEPKKPKLKKGGFWDDVRRTLVREW